MLDLHYLADLAGRHADLLKRPVAGFDLRGETFNPWPEASMMGVVNLSEDSWYRESVVLNVEAAVRRGRRLAAEGAKLVDIGAESTILQARRVDAQAQASLLMPVVRQLSEAGVLVSVESYHPEVTLACLEAGAAVVNLTAAENTEVFYRMAAEHGAGVVICHIHKGANPREVGDLQLSGDHFAVLHEYFAREIERAGRCGLERLWIDPGLGFSYQDMGDNAARARHQMETLLNTFRLRGLGWPVCHTLPHAFEYFEEEFRCAEPFFGMLALLGQTDLLRTHEVAKLRGVIAAMKVMP